jgi:hypothetical protein
MAVYALPVVRSLEIRLAYIFSFSFCTMTIGTGQNRSRSIVMMASYTAAGHLGHLCVYFM